MEEEKDREKEKKKVQPPHQRGSSDWNIRPYLAMALLFFLLFCCCIVVFFVIYRFHGVSQGWNKIQAVLQPITMGLVLAYLLNPIMKFFERHMKHFLKSRMDNENKIKKISRTVGTTGAIIVLFLVLLMLFEMMVPQLVKSIAGMVNALPDQVRSLTEWFDQYVKSENRLAITLENALVEGTNFLENWVKTSLLPDIQLYVTSVTSGVINVVKVVFNFLVGLIVSVYVLMSKEKFMGQAKKIVYAVFKPVRGNIIVTTVRKSNEIFGGFISGKILDSAIIGVLCYIVLSIMHMPYTLLVSAFVGLTNIIPFFGPFIGGIPSFIIIVLASPIQGLYFAIFIVILQQIDGNIIGPKILGDSTGLTSFWVVFAIMVGGGLFGIPGMILGVPTFAVIYYLVTHIVNYFLRRRTLSEATDDYIHLDAVDVKTNEMIYPDEEEKEPVKTNRKSKK